MSDLFRIPQPCDRLGASDAPSSFCAHCQRDIPNLSAMTRAQAEQLKASGQLHCASYWVDARGEIIFADSPEESAVELARGRGVLMDRLWTGAQVLTLPMLLAACEPASPAQAVSPIASVQPVKSAASPAPAAAAAPAPAAPSAAPKAEEVPSAEDAALTDEAIRARVKRRNPVTLRQSLNDIELIQMERQQRAIDALPPSKRPHARHVAGGIKFSDAHE